MMLSSIRNMQPPEMVLRKLNGKAPIPACLSTEPAYGKKVYNMRPDALKMKPKRKK